VTINGLQEARVTPDGTKVLALVAATLTTPNSLTMAELDPVTLSQTGSTQVTEPLYPGFTGNISGGFSFANDGNAIAWSDVMVSVYAYGTSSRTWTAMNNTLGQRVASQGTLASGDGSIVMIAPFSKYVASMAAVQPLATQGNLSPALASADLTGSEFATYMQVVDQQGQLLGLVPGNPRDMLINAAGTWLYGVQGTADLHAELHRYDLTATPSGGDYPELGTAITLTDDGTNLLGAPVRLAITPDERTVFLAGSSGISVQPVP
jgi:hypothetical protein